MTRIRLRQQDAQLDGRKLPELETLFLDLILSVDPAVEIRHNADIEHVQDVFELRARRLSQSSI